MLVDAIRTYPKNVAGSEDVHRRVAERYYDDRLELSQAEQLGGSVEAQRLRLLKADLRDDPLDL